MRRPRRAALLLLGAIVFLSSLGLPIAERGFAADKSKEDLAQAFAKLERGMTPDQVRERVGVPRRIARQILSHRYLEQWIYDSPFPARIQFDCPRGQQPLLVWKQIMPGDQDDHGHLRKKEG